MMAGFNCGGLAIVEGAAGASFLVNKGSGLSSGKGGRVGAFFGTGGIFEI